MANETSRGTTESDAFRTSMMFRAVANGEIARFRTSPNPWVGAVIVDRYGALYDGATEPPGSAHAERVALNAAGDAARGSTLFTTLEPCSHHGRTAPCTDAIIEAGVERVIISILDPDENVRGEGMATLIASGVDVTLGVEAAVVTEQLAPYLTHRTTGRPRVIVKLAMTLDGFIAAPDGSSKWITGPEARSDVHRLRAQSDAIVVGTGTVAADDPSLTVRDYQPPHGTDPNASMDPWRIVLGDRAAGMEPGARSAPFEPWDGPIEDLLDELGGRGMLQLLVEGGGETAGAFHSANLVDEYWIYIAPAIMGGSAGRSLFVGEGAPTMGAIQRGRFAGITQLGEDFRLVYLPS